MKTTIKVRKFWTINPRTRVHDKRKTKYNRQRSKLKLKKGMFQ